MAVPIDIQDEDHFEELLGKETPKIGLGFNHIRDNR